MKKTDLIHLAGMIAAGYLGYVIHVPATDPTCKYVTERYQYLVQHSPPDDVIYVDTGSMDE